MKFQNKKYLKILFIGLIFFALIGFVGQVSAQLEYTPLAPLPGIGDDGPVPDLAGYLVAVFQLAIGIAAALAVIMITIGGIQYMSTDSMFGKSEGKEKIKQALSGLLLAIAAWLILYTVNPDTLNFNFNPAPIDSIDPADPGNISTNTIYKVGLCVTRRQSGDIPREAIVREVASFTLRDHGSMAEAMSACRADQQTRPHQDFVGCLSLMYDCTPVRPR